MRLLTDDELTIDAQFNTHVPTLYNICYCCDLRQHEAEDVEATVRAEFHYYRPQPTGQRSWVRTATTREAVHTRTRRQTYERRHVQLEAAEKHLADAYRNGENLMSHDKLLSEMMAFLTPDERTAFTLYFDWGLSIERGASAMGVTPGMFMWLLGEVRVKLTGRF